MWLLVSTEKGTRLRLDVRRQSQARDIALACVLSLFGEKLVYYFVYIMFERKRTSQPKTSKYSNFFAFEALTQ